jgi:hypothetical protein
MLLLTSSPLLFPMQMSLLDNFQDLVRAICSVEIPGIFEGMWVKRCQGRLMKKHLILEWYSHLQTSIRSVFPLVYPDIAWLTLAVDCENFQKGLTLISNITYMLSNFEYSTIVSPMHKIRLFNLEFCLCKNTSSFNFRDRKILVHFYSHVKDHLQHSDWHWFDTNLKNSILVTILILSTASDIVNYLGLVYMHVM